MIIDLLFAFFEAGLNIVLLPFPNSDAADGVFGHVETIAANLGALNYFLPIAETVTVVVAVIALFPIFLGVTLSLWVAAFLRGGSSVG